MGCICSSPPPAEDAHEQGFKTAKERFHDAKQKGDQKEMEDAAAAMAQALVRAKLARMKVAKLKREQAAQSMKALFAKERFKAARKAGLVDEMREAAAAMVQAVWRAKVARRQVELLRKQQCEEQAIKQIQGLFRMAKAKQITNQKRTQKRSAAKIQAIARGRIARKQMEMDLRSATRPIVIEIVQCRNIGQVHSPYVIIAGLDVPKSEENPFPPTMCIAKSSVTSRVCEGQTVRFDEAVVIGGIDSFGCLIFTVCDHEMIGKDQVIGQAVLDLSKYPQLASTQYVLEKEMSLLAYEYTIQDSAGKPVKVVHTDCMGQGSIMVRVRIPPAPISICGWVERQGRKQVLQKQLWKNRYMVLANGHLKYYADKHSQDEAIIKGSMDMSTVTAIEDCCEEDGRKYIQITSGREPKQEIWKITIPEGGAAQATWMRRLKRAAPHLTNPDLVEIRSSRK